MMDYWTQFASTGNPNASDWPTWTPFALASPQEMELGATIAMRPVERKGNYELLVSDQLRQLTVIEPEPETETLAGEARLEEGE